MTLGIQAEFVQENARKLVDTLQSSAPGRVVLSTKEAILEPVASLEYPSFLHAHSKAYWYYGPMLGFKCVFSHPALNSLIVANETIERKIQIHT